MRAALYIAAKAPRAGLAKTRLAAGVGDERALALYRGFLSDLADRFTGGPLPVSWYVTPPDAWRDLAPLVRRPGHALTMLPQPEGDWAERQDALFRGAAGRGEDRTILIAADSPQLPAETVSEALAALGRRDLVLVPTHDGGYALIGMRGHHDVLRGVEMGIGTVLAEIARRARALGRSVAMLDPVFDVDEAGDLRLLGPALAGRSDLRATARALAALGPRAA